MDHPREAPLTAGCREEEAFTLGNYTCHERVDDHPRKRVEQGVQMPLRLLTCGHSRPEPVKEQEGRCR